jgi:hypothetical protein
VRWGSSAADEKSVKQTVDRLRRNEKGQLSEAMQSALDYARGEDHYVVMDARMFASGMPPGGSQEFFRGLKSVGIGASVHSSSVSVSGAFVFRRDRDAEDFAEGYEQAIEALESSLKSPYMPKRTRDAFEAMCEMLRELKVKQSGETVHFPGSWKLSGIEDLIEQFSGMSTL